MFRKTLWFLIITFFSSLLHAENYLYTWNDLKALKEQQEWSELLAHAKDIPPRHRSEPWRDLVRHAAAKKMEMLIFRQQIPEMLEWSLAILDKFPHLNKHRKFMQYRATAALKVFPECFNARGEALNCHKEFYKFALLDPTNSNLALQAGHIVQNKMFVYYALPFYDLAFRDTKQRSKYCKVKRVKKSVISALHNTSGRKEMNNFLRIAKQISLLWCWGDYKADLIKEVKTAHTGYLTNMCPELKKKGVLSGAALKKCMKYL